MSLDAHFSEETENFFKSFLILLIGKSAVIPSREREELILYTIFIERLM